MRRFALFVTGGAVWLLLMAVPVFADNGPHVMGQASNAATGVCASCHRAHSGQDPLLTKSAMPSLCTFCHNGSSSDLNVLDGVKAGGTAQGPLRGGGFNYTLIATNTLAANPSSMVPGNGSTLGRNNIIPTSTSHATTSAHSVSGSPVTMWGAGPLGSNTGTTGVNLSCGSCHDPHGNGQYRILKPTPSDVIVAWQSLHPYAAGETLTNSKNFHSYVVTVAGTSGTAAPATWPTDGTTVTDGTVTWLDKGATTMAVKLRDTTTNKTYSTTNYGQVGAFTADGTEDPADTLNTDGSALNYDTTTNTFSGTYFEGSSRWCAMCHTRYFAGSGSAGNQMWTEAGSADSVYKFRHAIRNIVDPTEAGVTLTGVINPISPSSQLKSGAAIGSYPVASAWKASAVGPPAVPSVYNVGAIVTPAGGHYYVATGTAPGTAGTVAPSWPNVTGATVVDGTVTWLDMGPASYNYRGVAVLSGASGINSATGTGQNLSTGAPRCITCHVSHGTSAAAGAKVTAETSLVTGPTMGSTLLRLDGRTACQACHAK